MSLWLKDHSYLFIYLFNHLFIYTVLFPLSRKQSVCSHLIWSPFREAQSDSSCVRITRLSTERSLSLSLRRDTAHQQSIQHNTCYKLARKRNKTSNYTIFSVTLNLGTDWASMLRVSASHLYPDKLGSTDSHAWARPECTKTQTILLLCCTHNKYKCHCKVQN